MSLNNDVKAPPTQIGAPSLSQQLPLGSFPPQSGQINKPLAPNAAPNTVASPMGHMNPQMNSRPIPSNMPQGLNNNMPPGAGLPPMPNQKGDPHTINGATNQFVPQVRTR